MKHPDAERWNKRYLIEGPVRIRKKPSWLVREFADLIPKDGLVLDTACGVAQNSMYLAELGIRIIGLDISLVALRLASQKARRLGLRFSAAVMDLTDPWFPPDTFDGILNFRFLERKTLAGFPKVLKPGGLILFETYLWESKKRPDPDYYLKPGELLEAFAGFKILRYGRRSEQDRVLEYIAARKG
jgi:tellurite methyltransferase